MINKSEYKGLLLIAILSPLAALIISAKRLNVPFLKLIIPLFYAFVGFTFQVRGGSDISRTVEMFNEIKFLSFSKFLDKLTFQLDNFLTEGIEVFQFSSSFLVSLLTDDYRVLLMFYGLIIGVFTVKVIQELLKINNGKGAYVFIFFIFSTLMPIWTINGRFWLATIILMYFLLKYFNQNSKIKFLIYGSLVILIHQGYFFGIIFLFLWHLISKTKSRAIIVYVIFSVSLFFSTGFAVNYAKNAASNFGGKIERQISGYVDDEFIEEISNMGNSRSLIWKIYDLKNDLFYYTILIFSLLITYFNKNKTLYSQYIFLVFLMIASLSNFTIGIPNFGSRYRAVAAIIGLVYIYSISNRFPVLKLNYLARLLSPIFYFVFIVNLRYEFEQMNFFVIFSNIPLLLYDIPNVTVMEFIK